MKRDENDACVFELDEVAKINNCCANNKCLFLAILQKERVYHVFTEAQDMDLLRVSYFCPDVTARMRKT